MTQPQGFSPIIRQQFSDAVYLQVEQAESHLDKLFMKETVIGSSLMIPRIGIVQMGLLTGSQYGKVEFSTLPTSFRSLTMARYEVVVPISQTDVNLIKIDPTGYVSQRVASAIGRQKDDVHIAALLGVAATGQYGMTSGGVAAGTASLPSGNLIAVNDWTYQPGGGSGNVGLTIGKINHMRKIILANRKKLGLPTDNLVLIMNANQHAHLMTDDKFVNAFYNKTKPLAGEPALDSLGLDIVISEEMGNFLDSSGYEQVILCDKNALRIGVRGKDGGESIEIQPRFDLKDFVWQVKGLIDIGSVRMEEELVCVASCAQ